MSAPNNIDHFNPIIRGYRPGDVTPPARTVWGPWINWQPTNPKAIPPIPNHVIIDGMMQDRARPWRLGRWYWYMESGDSFMLDGDPNTSFCYRYRTPLDPDLDPHETIEAPGDLEETLLRKLMSESDE